MSEARREDRVERPRGGGRTLDEVLPAEASVDRRHEKVRVRSVTPDSRAVEAGALYVAIRGTNVDGHEFVEDAIHRGAAAVMVEEAPATEPAVPVIRVGNTRRALAEVASRWMGDPGSRLPLAGVTGTVGKTSVLSMLEAMLLRGGRRPGVVGSLGLRINGETVEETGYTSPDPLRLHGSLARIVEAGCEIGAMEVTSHALVQERVHGLEYDLGVFTNLIPLEHSDFHGSFRNYVEAKRRFLDHLAECAPLIYNADDRAVRRMIRGTPVKAVGTGRGRTAVVRIEACETSAEGTRLVLNVRRPLPRPDGGEVAPLRLPLMLSLLGRSNVSNAALAATAGLCLGVEAEAIAGAVADFPSPRRRMQIVHSGDFIVLDDTVGHPESVSIVFEVAEAFAPRRIHVAFAVRGQRGVRINREVAEAAAIWAERLSLDTMVVTRSAEAADELNQVEEREHAAFLEPLRARGIAVDERDRLDEAVSTVMERARPGDLVLLLGAQGMDEGQTLALRWLEERQSLHPG